VQRSSQSVKMMWEMHLTESDARGKTDASLNWRQRDLRVTLASSIIIKRVIIYRPSVTSHFVVLIFPNIHVLAAEDHNQVSIIKVLGKITCIQT
jgi:hypothetical protein